MAILANRYFQLIDGNYVDLSNVCEKDIAADIITASGVNSFSYPKLPSGGGASSVNVSNITTNIYQNGSPIVLPRVGTYPSFHSKLLYSGYSSTVSISMTTSELRIGSSTWYPNQFYKGVLPSTFLIVVVGGGGGGAGSTNLYTGGGGGGGGGISVVVTNFISGAYIELGSGGSASTVAAGGTAGSGGTSIVYYDRNHSVGIAYGGGGGGVVNGGGGGGAGGSASKGNYNYSGAAGGGGSGSESYGGSAGGSLVLELKPYDNTNYKTGVITDGGSAGSGGRSGGGGGASYQNGGKGSAKSSTASSGKQGSGGGGGGCKNGIFGAASTGGAGGSGYVYIYGGYAP